MESPGCNVVSVAQSGSEGNWTFMNGFLAVPDLRIGEMGGFLLQLEDQQEWERCWE